ncbi:MAG TPA: TadG family pilus assembly protein [Thermohalobaculum sp.]|nr:TadG family pilus assembly protein [Thermohalobaculum sp.]
MRNAGLSRFMADERGGGTIMGLFWFMVLLAAAGLAVDSTDGLRNKTMLQATADAAALAAAIDLPNETQVVDTAVTYATSNMVTGHYGSVLNPGDVTIGTWDHATRTFIANAALPDAVHVLVRRATANDNAVPVNFLRIIGFDSWDVQAQSIAQRFIPPCLRDGLISRQIVDISSNNDFVKEICVHGEQGVDMQNGNYFELGTTVSMPDLDMLVIPNNGMTSNPGLPDALRENYLDPRMVNHIDEIMLAMLGQSQVMAQAAVLPNYINPDLPVLEVDASFNLSNAEEGRIYHVGCEPSQQVKFSAKSTLTNVVIIADCIIHLPADISLADVVLGSRSGGNGDVNNENITMAANVNLGAPDGCAEGGGVTLLSNASIKTAASTSINGVQMVAKGYIELTARNKGINGISAQAGGDITMTANNIMGLCSGGAPNLFTVPYYRLVL